MIHRNSYWAVRRSISTEYDYFDILLMSMKYQTKPYIPSEKHRLETAKKSKDWSGSSGFQSLRLRYSKCHKEGGTTWKPNMLAKQQGANYHAAVSHMKKKQMWSLQWLGHGGTAVHTEESGFGLHSVLDRFFPDILQSVEEYYFLFHLTDLSILLATEKKLFTVNQCRDPKQWFKAHGLRVIRSVLVQVTELLACCCNWQLTQLTSLISLNI